MAPSATNPLSVPEPSTSHREQLFNSFAPLWAIDTVDKYDLPGTPRYTPSGQIIDTSQPVLYRLLSHTRFQGQVLLPLNYITWLPARSPEKS